MIPITVRFLLLVAVCTPAWTQTTTPTQPPDTPADTSRVLGVLPNYRIGSLSDPYEPLTVKRKFYIGYKDSTDYPIFIVGGFLAGISQLTHQHDDFGQGFKGYAHRYWTSTSDQLIGNFMTESILPSLLHQDPRYFRKGEGGTGSRLTYAATRIFVAKTDHGHWTFNASEVFGNAISSGISNVYYPRERHLGDNVQRLSTQLATDAFSQILKEFWPDIKHKLHHEKSAH